MWDDYKGVKYLRPIGFVNPYIKNDIESIFYVDRGITSINVKIKVNDRYRYEIKGSKQNDPFYRHLEFSDLNKNQSITEREKIIGDDLSLIKKYPYSFHFLHSLYFNRELYTSDEMKLLIAGFTDDTKALLPYNKLKAWIAYRQQSKANLPDLILENEKSGKAHVLDTTAKINMLVFWASWCTPCRREIPILKEIYLKYHAKGLAITSISIDNNEKSWQNALSVEKMPWNQFITNDAAKNALDLQYNLSAIPVIVLLNKEKKVIKRFMGISPKEEYYRALSVLDEK
jgi:thiol-disulfide isomerase/thioredoxin